ncbi:MAG: hypothetical protein MUE85_20300 [Microscillaceae bacterium]|jgi:hypothetical protein|nr:hypothetical protein [Microscillaceae bacterium]
MKIVRLPLDAQDLAKLEKDSEGEPYVKPVLGTASGLSLLGAIYVFAFSGWTDGLTQAIVGGFWLIFSIMSYVGIGLAKKYYANNRADRQGGEKEVIVGTITQKEFYSERNAPDRYYFYIDEQKILVPWNYYSQFEEGNVIALHRAPLSELVLKVEPFH